MGHGPKGMKTRDRRSAPVPTGEEAVSNLKWRMLKDGGEDKPRLKHRHKRHIERERAFDFGRWTARNVAVRDGWFKYPPHDQF